MSSYDAQNRTKSSVSAALMLGTSSWRVPSGLARSMARPRLTWAGWTTAGLPSTLAVRVVHLGHRLQRLDQGEADEVGEGDLAAAGSGQVVVDHDAVVDEQLGGHRPHARRGRDGEGGLHVGDDAGGRSAQRRRLVASRLRLAGRRSGRGRSGRRCRGLARGGGQAVRDLVVGCLALGRLVGDGGIRACLRGDRLRGRRCFLRSRRGGVGIGLGVRGCAEGGAVAALDRTPRRRGRSAGSRRRSPTTPGRPSCDPGGTARTARRRATRWARRPASGSRSGPGLARGLASFARVADDGLCLGCRVTFLTQAVAFQTSRARTADLEGAAPHTETTKTRRKRVCREAGIPSRSVLVDGIRSRRGAR